MIEYDGRRFFRVREVAQVLNKSVQQVGVDIRLGRLKAVVVSGVRHVREEDLEAFLNGEEVVPTTKLRTTTQMRRNAAKAGAELRRRGYKVATKPER